MMDLELEAVFEYQAIPADEMWHAVAAGRPSAFPETIQYQVYDRTCSLDAVSNVIRGRGKPHFVVRCEFGVVDFGAVGNHNLSFISIGRGLLQSNGDAIDWMRGISSLAGFVHGRLYERNYDYWQNAADPLEYETGGRSTEGMKMKSNGLPFPLEQQVIDTSENPGRRVLRDGFIESVGHLMWFGELFWERTGQVRCIPDWVQSSSRLADVDFVELRSEPFTEGDGSEELQDLARKQFFATNGK